MARRPQGVIKRRPLPVGLLAVLVSSRRGWYQRTPLPLFSHELEQHLLRIGAAERRRLGLDVEFSVEARGSDADSWQRLTWPAGSLSPVVDEREAVDPPFERDEDGSC
jgi:hypothetical protein